MLTRTYVGDTLSDGFSLITCPQCMVRFSMLGSYVTGGEGESRGTAPVEPYLLCSAASAVFSLLVSFALFCTCSAYVRGYTL